MIGLGNFLFINVSECSLAAFVDVIHTDRTFAGTGLKVGTVDFWPNHADELQPGCPKPVQVGMMELLNGAIPLDSE